MKGWIIFAIIVAVLYLLSLIRFGGRAVYAPEGVRATLIAGPFRIQLLPGKTKSKEKAKKERPKKQREKKKPKAAQVHPEEKSSLGRFMKLVPVICEAAGGLKRRIRIDKLNVSVIWGAEDAASAAIGYGKANAVAGALWPLIHNNFKVKDCNFHVDVDYGRTTPEIQADAAFTMTVGQILSFALHYGVKMLTTWSRSGKNSARRQEANSNERDQSSH